MQNQNLLDRALIRLFDMDEEDAREVAGAVLDAFEGREELPDDRLDTDLRSIFYTLEAKKLLSFRREDYSSETGDRRRAFYWRLRADVIRGLLGEREAAPEPELYMTLPSDVWSRRGRAS